MLHQHDRRAMGPVTIETVVPAMGDGAAGLAGPSAGRPSAAAAVSSLRGATPPSLTGATASGSSPSCASRGTTPPAAATAGPSGATGGSPDTAEGGGARRWDRDRPPPDGDVVIGPSGKAVSYAALVKSGREPSLPPRPSKEGTPAEETTQLEQKPFISGNPFVEVTKGLLHLYKEK